MPHKPNPSPELIGQTAPEATDAWFARANPAKDVLLGLLGDAAAPGSAQAQTGAPAFNGAQGACEHPAGRRHCPVLQVHQRWLANSLEQCASGVVEFACVVFGAHNSGTQGRMLLAASGSLQRFVTVSPLRPSNWTGVPVCRAVP